MRLRLLAMISIACLLLASGGYAAGDTSIDNTAGKVTIRHGPIENLGMPKMTMVFRAKDPVLLDRLKEGDKILSVAEKVDGALTVMSFEPAK